MAFNQLAVKNFFTGAQQAYVANGAATAGMNGSKIALNTVVAGTTTSTAGLVLALPSPAMNIEWDSLYALVQTGLTTNTIVVVGKWQASLDGVNWSDILGINAPANVQVAAAGTGGLITTTWFHSFAGINPATPFIRYAVVNTVVTGAAGDNVVVSYGFRKRWTGA